MFAETEDIITDIHNYPPNNNSDNNDYASPYKKLIQQTIVYFPNPKILATLLSYPELKYSGAIRYF